MSVLTCYGANFEFYLLILTKPGHISTLKPKCMRLHDRRFSLHILCPMLIKWVPIPTDHSSHVFGFFYTPFITNTVSLLTKRTINAAVDFDYPISRQKDFRYHLRIFQPPSVMLLLDILISRVRFKHS